MTRGIPVSIGIFDTYEDVDVSKSSSNNGHVVAPEELPPDWRAPESLSVLLDEIVERQYDGTRARRFYRLVGRCRGAGLTMGQTVTYLTPWCETHDKFVGRVGEQVAACWDKVDEAMTIRFPPVAESETEPEAEPEVDVTELLDFLAEDEPEYVWLVPKLLEKEERLILTGGEGNGKTTWMRQFGVQSASGIHPITREAMEPIRTLIIDLENPKRIIKRSMRQLQEIAGSSYVKGNLHIIAKSDGLDLASKDDAQWLSNQVHRHKPDLLIIGPLYKMTNEDLSDNMASKLISNVLDQIRTHYHCTVLIEAHLRHAAPGHPRPTRPYGASLWLRWPEFGLYLGPGGELKHWRNPRDKRPWPESFIRGDLEKGDWPWMVGGATETLSSLADGLRRFAEAETVVVDIVGDNPGINTGDLTKKLKERTGISAGTDLSKIVLECIENKRIIRKDGIRNNKHHFLPDVEGEFQDPLG